MNLSCLLYVILYQPVCMMLTCLSLLFKSAVPYHVRPASDKLRMDSLIDKMTGSCQACSIELASVDLSLSDGGGL